MEAMDAISCDCGAGKGGGECYASAFAGEYPKIAVVRACPFVAQNVSFLLSKNSEDSRSGFFTMAIAAESFEVNGFCQNVQIYFVPVASFEQATATSLSSQVRPIFTKTWFSRRLIRYSSRRSSWRSRRTSTV